MRQAKPRLPAARAQVARRLGETATLGLPVPSVGGGNPQLGTGREVRSSGDNSRSMGTFYAAGPYGPVAPGHCNSVPPGANATRWTGPSDDLLVVVGNGTGSNNRPNFSETYQDGAAVVPEAQGTSRWASTSRRPPRREHARYTRDYPGR